MEAIRALKMNKAAGPDEALSELLVHGGKYTNSFTEHYQKLGEENQSPNRGKMQI